MDSGLEKGEYEELARQINVKNPWTSRFIKAAIIQTVLASVVTVFLIFGKAYGKVTGILAALHLILMNNWPCNYKLANDDSWIHRRSITNVT